MVFILLQMLFMELRKLTSLTSLIPTYAIYHEGNGIGYEALEEYHREGVLIAEFAAYGADGSHAWGVEQAEYQERQHRCDVRSAGGSGEGGGYAGAFAEEYGDGAYYAFLGEETANEGSGDAPVAEA